MKKKLFQNWKSGLTVSLVSIPLALALSIASGATPTQGIITAVWAGLIGAIFGSSNFNIIGPTGALSGVLVSYAILHGNASLPIVAIVSGIFILVAFLLHLDKYIIFIPGSVVHGFTLGVAFIIALGQIDNAFGLVDVPKGERLMMNTWNSFIHLRETELTAFLIFIFSALFIYFWNKKFSKMPGAIVIAFLGIVGMFFVKNFNLPISLVTLGEKYPSIRQTVFQNIFTEFRWEMFLNREIIVISLIVTVIAILETLLSGQIANQMTGSKFNRSKEVLGLSLANIGSGLMGGIPATAALARTVLNVKSGANHKTSGIISAIFIGIISLFSLNYFKLLPMPIIAAILLIVAIGMVEKNHFIRLIENERQAFLLAILVAIITVGEDPILGILIGTVIALLIFVNKISYGQTEVLIWKKGKMTEAILKNELAKRKEIDSDMVVYKLSGTLTYINMPAHLEAVRKIKGNKHVIISLRYAFYADIDGIDYLAELIENLKEHNEHIYITGVNKAIEHKIHKQEFYKKKLLENKIYKRTSDAISNILGSPTEKVY